MNLSSINLHSASHQIMGNLAGKYFSCLFRPLPGGALPPGQYNLSSPMSNSVYGTFALLSPVGPPAGSAVDSGTTRAGWVMKDWVMKDWVMKDWVTKGWVSQAGSWILGLAPQVNQPGVFVLVDKPLPGRNGIVITSGFADLMAALKQAGGAMVTIS